VADLEAVVMRRVVRWLGRSTGPLLIIMVSGSCGFVLGAALASAPSHP
jgi:hypothetical protein